MASLARDVKPCAPWQDFPIFRQLGTMVKVPVPASRFTFGTHARPLVASCRPVRRSGLPEERSRHRAVAVDRTYDDRRCAILPTTTGGLRSREVIGESSRSGRHRPGPVRGHVRGLSAIAVGSPEDEASLPSPRPLVEGRNALQTVRHSRAPALRARPSLLRSSTSQSRREL